MLCCILFDFVNRLSVRVPAGHNNLAVFPVFAEGAPVLSYLPLEEALAAGGFKVEEVGGGSVPELRRSDQFAMWRMLEQRINELGEPSPTSRMHALYEEDRESLEEAQRRLPWPAGACVVVAVINGRIVCVDLFDSPSTLGRLWPCLVTS